MSMISPVQSNDSWGERVKKWVLTVLLNAYNLWAP